MTQDEKDTLYIEFRARFIDEFMKRLLELPGYISLWNELRRWRTENQMNALTAKYVSTGTVDSALCVICEREPFIICNGWKFFDEDGRYVHRDCWKDKYGKDIG